MSDWDEITSFANLCRAAKRSARCKRRVAGAARFLERLEPEALALQRELIEGRWRPSRPVQFTIHDPKERVITAAPFRDRVVHHALIDPLEARLDAALVPQSFACRRGMGTHKALAHALALVRRHSHFLKLDIAKCFESIGHELVLTTIAPLIDDDRSLDLCRRVLGGPELKLGKGLPIGNLTSQWFANLVLGRVDRLVIEDRGTPGYVRYMDDFALFADDKQRLRADLERVEAFVRDELGLALKQRATILAPVSQGLPFLGWRIYRGVLRLRPDNARRTRKRLRHRRWELRTGRLAPQSYTDAVQAVFAHLHTGETAQLRAILVAQVCASEQVWDAGPKRLRQPRQPRRQLEQLRLEREVGEPERQHAREPQRRQRRAPLQCVTSPDRAGQADALRP